MRNSDNGGEGTLTDGTKREDSVDENSNVEDHITEEVPEKRKKAKKDIPSQILEIMKQRKQKPVVDDDDDTKFLLSFRSELKTMTKSQKMDFYIGMLQLVKTITLPPPPRNVYSSLSSHSYSQSPQMIFAPNKGIDTTGPVPSYQQQSPLSPPEHSQHSLSGHADNAVVYEFLHFNNNN
ncbi:hypothetical protein JTB14_004170 [Gonioctena quinquepunctata]|nr:hypothetical protein JTB14_004170 [Gonioctena quinquepunctata]